MSDDDAFARGVVGRHSEPLPRGSRQRPGEALGGGARAKLADKRSLDLFRLRAHVFAKAELEDAVKDYHPVCDPLKSLSGAPSTAETDGREQYRRSSLAPRLEGNAGRSGGDCYDGGCGEAGVSGAKRQRLSPCAEEYRTASEALRCLPLSEGRGSVRHPTPRPASTAMEPAGAASEAQAATSMHRAKLWPSPAQLSAAVDSTAAGACESQTNYPAMRNDTDRAIGERPALPAEVLSPPCARDAMLAETDRKNRPPGSRSNDRTGHGEGAEKCPSPPDSLANWTPSAALPVVGRPVLETARACDWRGDCSRQTLPPREPSAASAGLGGGERRKVALHVRKSASRGEQPAFVVVGLNGVFAERVLLLPTSARGRELVGESPAQSVALTWGGDDSPQTLQLIRTKVKPTVCNPLPALATALSWAREFGAGVLPGPNMPLLPESLAPAGPPDTTCDHGVSVLDTGAGCVERRGDRFMANVASGPGGAESSSVSPSPACRGQPSERTRDRHTLSIEAAWMLAHQVFRQDAGGESSGEYMGRIGAPHGTVSVTGGEAAALSILSCPEIGWAPEPDAVLQALSDGGGSILCYAALVVRGDGKRGDWESEVRRAACEQLVAAGLCVRSEDGARLRLHHEVELAFELCLRIFAHDWGAQRETLAAVALGLLQTGPSTTGVRPQLMHALLATQPRSSRGIAGGRMGGRMGTLCVKLHSWCIEVSRGAGGADRAKNLLWRVHKTEIAGDSNSARVWNGPMAEALAVLGGAKFHNVDEEDTDGGWVVSMSKEERLLEAACLRVKEAVVRVLDHLCEIVTSWQSDKRYLDAATLLRILVRRDEGLAGEQYRKAPDLVWAADWCTSRFRGWAWVRLSLNLEKLGLYDECLEALRSGCEDSNVRGGDLVELRDRLPSKHKKYGDLNDTPPASPFRKDTEERIVVDMAMGKEGNRRSKKGGRLLFFDKPRPGDDDQVVPTAERVDAKRGIVVEAVALRKKHESEGWLGRHCESRGVMFLLMLLLWEDVFDWRVKAACGHSLANRPYDLYDLHFCARRRGLPDRLDAIARATDRELWGDVGDRFDRYKGVKCVWCSWREFTKQQTMEIAVSFGGRRLSYVLKALTRDLPHMHWGFPDLLLWRPKGRTGAVQNGHGGSCRGASEFGLGWEGEGRGWEVQVVEVKSENDTLSSVQRAWLSLLRDAGVPAVVTRVIADRTGAGQRS